ncbi:MAG: hypothetical protein RR389_01070 [Christensenella sp.]
MMDMAIYEFKLTPMQWYAMGTGEKLIYRAVLEHRMEYKTDG